MHVCGVHLRISARDGRTLLEISVASMTQHDWVELQPLFSADDGIIVNELLAFSKSSILMHAVSL